MKAIMDLKQLLEEELEKIVRKGDITPVELERLDKAVDIIKDIETICAMKEYNYQEEEEELKYSGRYPYYIREGRGGSYNSYRRSNARGNSRAESYMMNPYYYGEGRSYDEGGESYARGGSYMRDSYDDRSYEQSRDNSRRYSGHATKEDLKKDLQEMMNKASSEKERMAIQQFLEQWKD